MTYPNIDAGRDTTSGSAVSRRPRRRGKGSATDARDGVLHPKAGEFLMAVLGGCDTIGMNMTMYGSDGKWLLVDAGCTFPDDDDRDLGLEVIIPDPEFALRHAKDIVGMVVTHAHEDHVGAVSHLWPKIGCPIFCTPFAAEAVRGKLDERRKTSKVRIHTHKPGGSFSVGPFQVRTVPVAHSIPEATALAITTKAGTVVHTGDWKIDPNPVLGPKTDLAALKAIGDQGVLALMSDSTNAMSSGSTPSEGTTLDGFDRAFAGRKGAIVVGCFSSNVARLKSIALTAAKHGRKVALAGRSLVRMEDIGRKLGMFSGVAPFLSDAEIKRLPRREQVIICTGTQGEENAALSRIACAEHRHLRICDGDTVIFSARKIPGNEESIEAIQQKLRNLGATVLTPADFPVHVSGHPSRDDLAEMIRTVRPATVVPVHGTPAHLEAHAELSRSVGTPSAVLPRNGSVLRITKERGVEVLDSFPARMLAWNGARLVGWAPSETDPEAAMAALLSAEALGGSGSAPRHSGHPSPDPEESRRRKSPASHQAPRLGRDGRPVLSLDAKHRELRRAGSGIHDAGSVRVWLPDAPSDVRGDKIAGGSGKPSGKPSGNMGENSAEVGTGAGGHPHSKAEPTATRTAAQRRRDQRKRAKERRREEEAATAT